MQSPQVDDAHVVLAGYSATTPVEAIDLDAMRVVAATAAPFDRSSDFHLTASSLIVDPRAQHVLLRWHARHLRWMQVGGHGDPGEVGPYAIALREAREESGLADLRPFPDAMPLVVQVAVVDVPQSEGERAHRHGDVRYLMATDQPDRIRPEAATTPLRWCSINEARALVVEANLVQLLDVTEQCFERAGEDYPR